MKNLYSILFWGFAALLSACSEDLGNYDYTAPEIPVVTNLDSLYPVYVGDRLRIEPSVNFHDTTSLSYEWEIPVPEEMENITYEGRVLNIFFGLNAQDYKVRFCVVDNATGMKYFYYSTVRGKTDFSQGILLLTSRQGQAELSFIKPDGKIQTDLYGQMYGEPLPGSPRQLIAIQHEFMLNKPYLGYWVICSDTQRGGVQLDVNTLKRTKYLNENFFSIPKEEIDAQYFFPTSMAVMNGIINNRFYLGASSTYYLSPVYGYFGLPAAGEYRLAPYLIVREAYFLGYDTEKSGLVYFDGGGNFFGDNYLVQGTAFNPAKIGLDVLTMQSVSNEVNYIFGKDPADGQIYELKFSVKSDPKTITPIHKKIFSGQDKVDENTLWAFTNTEVFYISHQDKIYRYNPLNGEIKALEADFKQKNITLLKLKDSDTLIAGTDGYLCFLDIGTGKSGQIIRDFDQVTGEPVDLYIKE